MSGLAAVLIGGPPATGKSTLALALAPRLEAALLDLDVATGPLTRVVSELSGVPDLDDPVLVGLTRDARYDTLLGLAEANLAAGRPVVLVAPFSAERALPSAWAATTRRIPAAVTMVWLHLPPGELIRRLTRRALARDENKIRDPASYLTGLDLEPPAVPHLALDASQPTDALVTSVLNHLSCLVLPSMANTACHRWHNARESRYAIDGKAGDSDASATRKPLAACLRAGRPVSGTARLLDVANAAGVSLRTASRVLNDDPRVAAETRQRVQGAMLDLRFQPDEMARSLRAGTDTAVGFVVESISDPFFAEVIDAVELEMSRHGRSVLVTSTRRDHDRERDVIGRMMQRRIAGLLLSPTGDDHSWLDTGRVPVVLVDRPSPGLSADLVEIDDHRAAFDATAHLIARGHQRIAYVGDTPAIPTSAARLRGYRDALARHRIEADERLVNCDGATSQAAARAVSAMLSGTRPPTAILSATTRASLGVVPALHSAGRTDIALVSFGDFPMADALRPAVTVVDHPGHEVGRVAAARLLARLEQPGLPVERIQVPARIIERGSGELRP